MTPSRNRQGRTGSSRDEHPPLYRLMTERLLNATKWAAGFEERDAHVVVRLTPALRSEEFFETFCGLAQAGKLNKKGMPRNPLQLVVWTYEYRREIGPPSSLLRLALLPFFAALAPVGRLAVVPNDVVQP